MYFYFGQYLLGKGWNSHYYYCRISLSLKGYTLFWNVFYRLIWYRRVVSVLQLSDAAASSVGNVSLSSSLSCFTVPLEPWSGRSGWLSEHLPLSFRDGMNLRPLSEDVDGNWELLIPPLVLWKVSCDIYGDFLERWPTLCYSIRHASGDFGLLYRCHSIDTRCQCQPSHMDSSTAV